MASNGLVANPTKTAFMILNHKQEKDVISLKKGDKEITMSVS